MRKQKPGPEAEEFKIDLEPEEALRRLMRPVGKDDPQEVDQEEPEQED